jgi:hypothetical protein
MIEHKRLAAVSGSAAQDDDNANPMGMVERVPEVSVPIASLVPGFYLRMSGVDAAHVQLLADAAGSVRLPAILVQKSGTRIIDGMHRIEVAKRRGEWSIKARVVDCSDEEALILAVKSNTLHGLPLSRADRISGARRILAVHPDWSDRAVAVITGLSTRAIASLRNSTTGPQPHFKRLGQDGKRHPVVPGEGRLRAAEYIAVHPEASVREVARETDVSVGTAQKVRQGLRSGTLRVPDEAAHPAGLGEVVTGIADRDDASDPVLVTRPIPVTRGPGSAGRRAGPRPFVWPFIAPKLTSDPALRYTDGGRAFLRWMASHSTQADEWREFAEAIPAHWLDDVRGIALGMSEEWHQFAEWIKYRQQAVSLADAGLVADRCVTERGHVPPVQRHRIRRAPLQFNGCAAALEHLKHSANLAARIIVEHLAYRMPFRNVDAYA